MLGTAIAVVAGVALGLSLAAPPGPMNALMAREASRHGFVAGIRVGLGAPVADVLYLVILIFGAAAILDQPGVLRVAAVAGSAIMGFFAYTTWFPSVGSAEAADRPATFWAGLLAALTNPYQIAWWLSGGFVFLQAQGVPGVAGLVAGIFAWVVAFSWLVAHGAQRWPWFEPAIRAVSAALLAVFAVALVLVALGILAVG